MGRTCPFFTRFPIPWWLFLLSLLLGFANTEVVLAVSNYLIRINKGELYNGVIIGYALMNVFNALLSMLINLTGGYGSALVTLRARKLLWRKILHLPMREVERRQPSALISGLVNDITQASLVVQMAFNTIVSLYSFFRCCWEMYRFDGTLSLYMLLLLPIAVLVFALVGHLQYQMMLRRYDSLNVMTTFFSEHISAAKHVKAQAMEDLEVAEGLKAIDSRTRPTSTTPSWWRSRRCPTPSTTPSAPSSSRCAGRFDPAGQNARDRHQRFLHLQRAGGPVYGGGADHYQTLKGTQALCSMWACCWDGPEEDPQAGNPLPDKQTAQDIRLERVSFGYIPQQPVLHDLSFTIPHGKVTAIIGNNGSGKSTLLKLLQGIYAPDSGRIWLAARRWTSRSPANCGGSSGTSCKTTRSFPGRSVTTSLTAKPARRTSAGSSRRPAWPMPTALSASCQTAMTPTWARRARCCPAGSGSASPLRGLVHPPHLSADGRSRGQP